MTSEIANNLDEKLPVLKENQEFVCAEGCSNRACEVIEFDFSYSETLNNNFEVIERLTHKAYKTACCGGEAVVWDNSIDDYV